MAEVVTDHRKAVRPLTGRKFFLIVLAFFGIVMAVNAVFISLALKSNPGVVTKDYYERGIHFNDTLEQANYQKELGWTGELDASYSASRIVYQLRDKDGVCRAEDSPDEGRL